ncbi:TetR/AcrR family transcriptional regulator [Flavobacterium antarcticum]|uniref:TetR/AcrR family transcriptional regulator n=1 Tax=Flavobacterium antarcticum TaxID=271155 RepID=UPI0003B39529|nr:TetR family transcriptional regulator [Flavobacterium antarcticum]
MEPNFNEKQICILQVAEKLFAEKGFDGTSIRDISKAAKINIAMVSYYFGSKDKMLEALVLFRTDDLAIQIENLLKESLSPLEKMGRLIDFYITRINQNKDIYKIMHFELSSKKRVLNFESFTQVKKRNVASLRQIITEGQDLGIFNLDVNIDLIAPTILGTFFHFQMNRPYYENIFDLHSDEVFENYVKTDLTKHIKRTINALLLYEK